jgi:hypothetical protein
VQERVSEFQMECESCPQTRRNFQWFGFSLGSRHCSLCSFFLSHHPNAGMNFSRAVFLSDSSPPWSIPGMTA